MPLLPPSADRYAADQSAVAAQAMRRVLRSWRRMGVDFDASWVTAGGQIIDAMLAAQQVVATGAVAFVPTILADTGQRVRDAEYVTDPLRIVGTAGDGMPVESLAYQSVVASKSAVAAGATPRAALMSGMRFLEAAVPTLLSDTARTAERMAGHSRRVTGYVRMLQTPSCGRCIILAGRWTRSQAPFQRHPRCDCRNIPAAESIAGDMTVDPHEHLDNLDDQALARALGSKANAQAWRDGANPVQLINAYRKGGDVRSAQVYGRTVKYTTEGTTRRGTAYRAMRQAGYAQKAADARVGRYFATQAPRLMPESIYQIATSREDAKRLLRLYGWIT